MSKEWLGAGAYCPLELQKVKVGDTTGADKNPKAGSINISFLPNDSMHKKYKTREGSVLFCFLLIIVLVHQ